jgi:hypothetical protein
VIDLSEIEKPAFGKTDDKPPQMPNNDTTTEHRSGRSGEPTLPVWRICTKTVEFVDEAGALAKGTAYFYTDKNSGLIAREKT